ncbi:FMN-binding protein [Candidatus Woesearchaeota archaeon]|nr:FMN-binding protein [Candidatus Woesearchaeota archaeon]
MKDIIRLGMTLMAVTLIASLALAVTNYYTAPKIAMQKEAAIKESLNRIMDAGSFAEEDSYYNAYDAEGNLIGKVMKIEVHGYSSIIHALAGISLENEITGIEVISQQETPGLGAKIEKEGFLSQFRGKKEKDIALKKYGGKIDGVTGATTSSNALAKGLRSAAEEHAFENSTLNGRMSITEKQDSRHLEENGSIKRQPNAPGNILSKADASLMNSTGKENRTG